MDANQLYRIWSSGDRLVWYAYEGAFAPTLVWRKLGVMGSELSDPITDFMLGNHGFIWFYLPLQVTLDLIPHGKPQLPHFHVWWNPFEIDICGRNSFGSKLGITDNNENVFATYEECVWYCEWQNNQRIESKQWAVKCDWDSTFNYLKVLYKGLKRCCPWMISGSWKDEMEEFSSVLESLRSLYRSHLNG